MNSQLRSGDFVEVRSATEVLKTLDFNGTLDGMPFVPEVNSAEKDIEYLSGWCKLLSTM